MGKTLLITGANRGIGLEMTRQATARGDTVIACTRNALESPDLVALARQHETITVLGLDVNAETDMKQIAAGMRRSIDILVCNAGALSSYGGLKDPAHNTATIENVLMTNIAGVFLTARSFLPHLLDGTPGKIAVISSIMGSQELASSNAPIYRASKAAATNLARSMSVELAPQAVAVGAFHPGWVRTDMGGPEASVSPSDSAAGLLQRFDALTLDRTGIFEDFQGNSLPF
jgi:NAD(P)-dependent dehydrogenase (short-subunit alcohol dehydrogenase family)